MMPESEARAAAVLPLTPFLVSQGRLNLLNGLTVLAYDFLVVSGATYVFPIGAKERVPLIKRLQNPNARVQPADLFAHAL